MSKQILLSLLNCSWQWMLLGGLTWFITSRLFHRKHRSNTTVHLLWLLSLLSLPILFGFKSVCASTFNRREPGTGISGGEANKRIRLSCADYRFTRNFIR